MTKSPFALSLSKGMSAWVQGRLGKALLSEVEGIRTGFDKLSPNGG